MKEKSKNRFGRSKSDITTDKFYTLQDECERIVYQLYNKGFFDGIDTIIEPAAGSGNFVEALWKLIADKKLNIEVYAYDIEPKHTSIIKQDFLKFDLNQFNLDTTAVIMNPPFGYCGNGVMKFMKKCSVFKKMYVISNGDAFRERNISNFSNKFLSIYWHRLYDIEIKNQFIKNDNVVKIYGISSAAFERFDTVSPEWIYYNKINDELNYYFEVYDCRNKKNEYDFFVNSTFAKKPGELLTSPIINGKPVQRGYSIKLKNISKYLFEEVWYKSISINEYSRLNRFDLFKTKEQFLKNIKEYDKD